MTSYRSRTRGGNTRAWGGGRHRPRKIPEPGLRSGADQANHARRVKCCPRPTPRGPRAGSGVGSSRATCGRVSGDRNRRCREDGAARVGRRRASAVANSSWTRSAGSSSRIAISSRTTLRSTSTSCGGQRRVEHDVADDVDGQRQVAVEHGRVEAGVLLLGERVELAAHGVHGTGDVERRTGRGALEEQVLEEVTGAGQAHRLVARTDGDPHADAQAAHCGHPPR